MAIAVISFFALFLLIVSVGLLLFYRQAMLQRVSSVVTPQSGKRNLLDSIQQTGLSIGGIVEHLDRVLPKSQAEISVVQQRLIRAGYRRPAALKIFNGAKILTPVVLVILVMVTGVASSNPFIIYTAALGLGFLVPDFWLGNRIKARQEQIRLGLPDVLDFLVICIEAGLGMDLALARTAEELRISHPAISDELDVVVLEQRAGRARADAWKEFSRRTDVDSVRNLVTVLVQSEQLGTSIAKTLRVHSDTLRIQRRQKIEELAAKTTVKLVFPLVLFIFPSLFLVAMGPEAIIISETFNKYLTH
jgi:tight adherence protein C